MLLTLSPREGKEVWAVPSLQNELANVSSSASMVIRNVLDGAGVSKMEITENLKTQPFDKRVVEELEEYKTKL